MKKIVEIEAGSRLYNLSTPTSDTDRRWVWLETQEELYGLKKPVETITQLEPIDSTGWSLKHFMRLAYDNNPNIIELLFMPLHYPNLISSSAIWQYLHVNRFLVLSQQMRVKSLGFAYGELERLKRKRTTQEPFDYDGKAASHCLRLIHQCKDVLLNGTFTPRVAMVNVTHLRAIKACEVPFNDVLAEIAELMEGVKTMPVGDLPEKGDWERWNNLAIAIYQTML